MNITNAAGSAPLLIKAANISFGDAGNKVAGVNTTGHGWRRPGLPGVVVQASGTMSVFTTPTGDFVLTGGTATGTNSIAAVAVGGSAVAFDVGGNLNVFGGTSASGGNAKALVQATSAKSVVVGKTLFIKGGAGSSGGDASASFDPSGTLNIVAGNNVIIQSGTGVNSGATLANEGALNITVNQGRRITLQRYQRRVNYTGLIVIGNTGSGLYNIDPILGKTLYTLGSGVPRPINIDPEASPIWYRTPAWEAWPA